jgi:hypothetical protein
MLKRFGNVVEIIFFKNLMYFQEKNTLNHNYYHTRKYPVINPIKIMLNLLAARAVSS